MLRILDQTIDALKNSVVGFMPPQIILPRAISPKNFHLSNARSFVLPLSMAATAPLNRFALAGLRNR